MAVYYRGILTAVIYHYNIIKLAPDDTNTTLEVRFFVRIKETPLRFFTFGQQGQLRVNVKVLLAADVVVEPADGFDVVERRRKLWGHSYKTFYSRNLLIFVIS
jgi:hypothetical protein